MNEKKIKQMSKSNKILEDAKAEITSEDEDNKIEPKKNPTKKKRDNAGANIKKTSEIEKIQEEIDRKKIEELRNKINGKNGKNDWHEFWKNEGYVMPSRGDVFPRGEDINMTDEEIVKSLSNFLKEKGLDYDNYTGINPEEFPEMIDKDIRELCVKLNGLSFLKTKEGCSGHEFYRSTGELYKAGFSEPYLIFYVDKSNSESDLFFQRLEKEMEGFKKSDLSGIENVTFDFHDESTKTKNIGIYWNKMFIIPTREWCKQNGRKCVKRPKELGFYDQWCEGSGYEYSDDEKSKSRKKWEKVKNKYWKQMDKFENEYSEYFRSEEVKKLRDEFFKVFEKSIQNNV